MIILNLNKILLLKIKITTIRLRNRSNKKSPKNIKRINILQRIRRMIRI